MTAIRDDPDGPESEALRRKAADRAGIFLLGSFAIQVGRRGGLLNRLKPDRQLFGPPTICGWPRWVESGYCLAAIRQVDDADSPLLSGMQRGVKSPLVFGHHTLSSKAPRRVEDPA